MVMMDDGHDDDERDDHDDASIRSHKVEVELFFPEKFDFIPIFSVVGEDLSTCPRVYIRWRNIF